MDSRAHGKDGDGGDAKKKNGNNRRGSSRERKKGGAQGAQTEARDARRGRGRGGRPRGNPRQSGDGKQKKTEGEAAQETTKKLNRRSSSVSSAGRQQSHQPGTAKSALGNTYRSAAAAETQDVRSREPASQRLSALGNELPPVPPTSQTKSSTINQQTQDQPSRRTNSGQGGAKGNRKSPPSGPHPTGQPPTHPERQQQERQAQPQHHSQHQNHGQHHAKSHQYAHSHAPQQTNPHHNQQHHHHSHGQNASNSQTDGGNESRSRNNSSKANNEKALQAAAAAAATREAQARHEVSALSAALSNLQDEIIALRKTNEDLVAKNVEIDAQLIASEELAKKKEEDMKTLNNVMRTYSNIRADLEKQRDSFQSQWKKSETEKRTALAELEDLRRSNAAQSQTRGGSSSLVQEKRVLEMQEKILALERDLVERSDQLAAAQRESSMKAIDLELKEAEEAYLKVRLENMEAELCAKDAKLKDLDAKFSAAKATMAQYEQVIKLLHDQQQQQSKLAVPQSDTASIVFHSPSSADTEEELEERKTSGTLEESSISTKREISRQQDNLIAERKSVGQASDLARESSAESEARKIGAEDEEGNDDVNDDDDGSDEAWLFALRTDERELFIRQMEYENDEVRIISDIQQLVPCLRGLKEELLESADDSMVAIEKKEIGSFGYWKIIRDALTDICSHDVLFIWKVNRDPESVLLARQFVSVLAEAYESAEDPGKVILGLEGWESDQIGGEDATGEGTAARFHDVLAFHQWSDEQSE